MTLFRVHVQYGTISDSVDVRADTVSEATVKGVKKIKATFEGKAPSVIVKKVKVVKG